MTIIPNTKEYTHTTIPNIKKRQEYTYLKRKKNGERKNMKKNHINFAHPNKLSNSLASLVESPSVATEIAMGQRTKIKFANTNFGVTTIVYSRKLRKKTKR